MCVSKTTAKIADQVITTNNVWKTLYIGIMDTLIFANNIYLTDIGF